MTPKAFPTQHCAMVVPDDQVAIIHGDGLRIHQRATKRRIYQAAFPIPPRPTLPHMRSAAGQEQGLYPRLRVRPHDGVRRRLACGYRILPVHARASVSPQPSRKYPSSV